MSHSAGTRRVQTAHFDTTRETSKSLARQPSASASLNALSAGSPGFYMPLPPPQTRLANFVPVGPHSASGGDVHENMRALYGWPDDVGSVSASDTALPSLCRPLQGHRSEEHTSELQSPTNLVCRLLLEKKK